MDCFDQRCKDAALDAVVCNINEFHAVNEQYGLQFGDLVLRSVGVSMKKLARKTGGICCRKEGDSFLLYCPHREDYDLLLRRFLADLFVEKETASKVSLRFGVFPDAGREPDVEERFVLVAEAVDSVRNDPEKICGFYEYK